MKIDTVKRKEIADSIVTLIAERYMDAKGEAVVALVQVSEFFQSALDMEVPESVKSDIKDQMKKVGPSGEIQVDLKRDRWESQRQNQMYG